MKLKNEKTKEYLETIGANLEIPAEHSPMQEIKAISPEELENMIPQEEKIEKSDHVENKDSNGSLLFSHAQEFIPLNQQKPEFFNVSDNQRIQVDSLKEKPKKEFTPFDKEEDSDEEFLEYEKKLMKKAINQSNFFADFSSLHFT